jgi:hypothetical protein
MLVRAGGPQSKHFSTERKQVNRIGKMKVAVSDSFERSRNASVIQSSVVGPLPFDTSRHLMLEVEKRGDVHPLESMAQTQPKLQPAFLRLQGIISQYFTFFSSN